MDVDDRTKAIMERAKQRKAELESEEKENYEETILSPILQNSPSKQEQLSSQVNTYQEQKPRRSAFAALAEEYDNFAQQSPPKTRIVTKEDYVKGKSHRLSIGETRPSVLCTPAGFATVSRSPTKQNEATHISMNVSPAKVTNKAVTKNDMEESRHIRFAHPISATYYDESSGFLNESSIVAGNFVDSSLRSLTNSTATGNESQECGAHLFIRKKTPTKSASAASLQVCSPQPFSRGGSTSSFSSVMFNPSATSSPKAEESSVRTEQEIVHTVKPSHAPDLLKIKSSDQDAASQLSTGVERKNISPIRVVALENAAAKNIVHVLEERLKETPHKNTIPVPKSYCTPGERTTPLSAIKTQWRGATATPIVSGATPGEPTVPNTCGSNIKSLRNRWEFSSITGTPLHPDETEDALVQAALKMRDTSIPRRVTNRITEKCSRSVHPGYTNRSATTSPSAKSPRCKYDEENKVDEVNGKENNRSERRKVVEEVKYRATLDNEDSGTNISKFIDDAFEFMGESPIKNSSQLLPSSVNDVSPTDVKEASNKVESPLDNDASLNSTIKYDDEMKEEPKNVELQYTISYYRKRARQEKVPDPNTEKIDLTMSYAAATSQQILGNTSISQPEVDIDEQKRKLEETIYAQRTKIHQASKALQLCRNREQFRGSHEEATAQWAVLIETEILRAAESEIERLNSHGLSSINGPLGSLTISYLSVELNKDFIETYSNIRSANVFYFCLILRSADQVLHSTIVSSEEAVKRGAIEIVQPLVLKNLPTNFTAALDVYAYRSVRAQYTHEEKFGLKGTTMKNKSVVRPSHHSSPSDSSFQLVGRLALDIHVSNGKKRLLLSDARHPLDGHITVKIKKMAVGKSTTTHSGFLSMFQRTKEGLGSWNRYWCVLEQGGMKFWRRPEDEVNQRNWLVLLDLQTCAGEKDGASEANEPCQYMQSFFIDVWVPKEGQDAETLNRTGRPEMEKLRVMLAADTKEEMRAWLEDINSTVKQLLTWNRPFAFAK